jgi:mono/diheme cytochrome c family protein
MRGCWPAVLGCVLAALLLPGPAFAQKKTNRVIYTPTEGRQIYTDRCAVCHLPDGKGRGGEDTEGNGFPPLIGMSEWLATREGQRYAAHAIIYGPYGAVLVGDRFYYGLMPRFGIRFTDEQIVQVIRYIAEVINKPARGYRPIDQSVVQEARALPDNMTVLEMERNELPPR